jgi:arsenate reductase
MCRNKGKIKVLFVCTGNSCRSQMAEGWARHLKGDIIDAYSAGLMPTPVHPRAVKVMKEAGVDISKQKSKHICDLIGTDFDYVITVCDYARQQCPMIRSSARILHRGFEDPSFLEGTEDEIMAAFRKTRDEIKDLIINLADTLHLPNKTSGNKNNCSE